MKYPTLATYLDWARAEGHAVETRVLDGQFRLLVIIRGRDGGMACECLEDEGEMLMSTTVARLDRMLGSKSGLFC